MKKLYFFISTIVFTLILTNTYPQQVDFEWVKQIGDKNLDVGYSIAVDNNKNIYSTGCFSDTVKFEDTTLISKGGSDIFIAKLKEITNNIDEIVFNNGNLKLYPNPNNGNFFIKLHNLTSNNEYSVYVTNIYGQILFQKENIPVYNNMNIDISKHSKGVYFIKLIYEENVYTGKIIYQ